MNFESTRTAEQIELQSVWSWRAGDEEDITVRGSGDVDVETAGAEHQAKGPQSEAPARTVKSGGTLGPWQAAVIFITNDVGIGILSLPFALKVLGLVPGVIFNVGMGISSLYTANALIDFHRRYPHVRNIVDYGRVIGGRLLGFVFAVGYLINCLLICAAAATTMSIGINTISGHAARTIIWVGLACTACCAICVPRTMMFVSHCGWPCTVSIVAGVVIAMIILGVKGPAGMAPGQSLDVKAFGNPTFVEAVSAFLNVAFAFTGNMAFIPVMVEMRNPTRDFMKAVLIEKSFAITMYTTVAVACYCLGGNFITSPVIGAISPTIAKVAYGIIFVHLLGTGLVFGHTAIKYLFEVVVRHSSLCNKTPITCDQRDQEAASQNNKIARPQFQSHDSRSFECWAVWISIAVSFWILVFIIANGFPVFESLLNISSSVLLAWFTWGIASIMWFYLNWHKKTSPWRKIALITLHVFILVVVLFMNTAGMYASVKNLLAVLADPLHEVNGPFTCADNSIF